MYERYVIEDAKYHMNVALKILEEGLADPEKYYAETKDHYQKLVKLIPFLYMLNNHGGECTEPPRPEYPKN